jgi:hypothetical protein
VVDGAAQGGWAALRKEGSAPSILSYAHSPSYSSLSALVYLPTPWYMPFFHCPSYTSPHAKKYLPVPTRVSFSHSPTYAEPESYLISPYPCRTRPLASRPRDVPCSLPPGAPSTLSFDWMVRASP